MKRPDEIKRELNAPIHVHYHHGDREPHMTPLAMIDLEQLHADALALIQQLQEEVSKYEEGYDALTKIVIRLEAERDAAVADLEHVKDCDLCKYDNACLTGKKDCFSCHEKSCPCMTCQYVWRGVQKEE